MKIVGFVVLAFFVLQIYSVSLNDVSNPIVNSSPSSSLSIAIFVQSSLLSSPSSDIALHYFALGELLSSLGHSVTFYYDEPLDVESEIISNLKASDFILEQIPRLNYTFEGTPDTVLRAYEIYEHLKTKHFDEIHFSDYEGRGYYVALAKNEGLKFQNSKIIVGLQQPYVWEKINNLERFKDTKGLEIDFMQKRLVELADYVISPSSYMVNYLRENEWKISEESTFVRPNLIPAFLFEGVYESITSFDTNEIIFFGDFKASDGLILFCDAVSRLISRAVDETRKFHVTFLGQDSMISGVTSSEYISLRAKRWNKIASISIISDLSLSQQVAYLRSSTQKIVVVAPEEENSPVRVQILIDAGINFLASDVGGISELLSSTYASRLFSPRPDKLSALLSEYLFSSSFSSHPSTSSFNEALRLWKELILQIEASPSNNNNNNNNNAGNTPLVSVVITHHDRPDLLRQAIASIERQTYSNIEIVLVDDKSENPESLKTLEDLSDLFTSRGWKIIYLTENVYLGKARNIGVKQSSGKYILFMDDDNVAKSDEVFTFVSVMQHSETNNKFKPIDVLTSAQDNFVGGDDPSASLGAPYGSNRRVPLGGDAATGFFWNCFGDANSMVRKSTFEEIGGFSEDYGVGYEDYEFFAKVVLAKGGKYRLEVIPESLFWYRRSYSSMSFATDLYTNRLRSLRPYLSTFEASPNLNNLLLIAQSLHYGDGDTKVIGAGGDIPVMPKVRIAGDVGCTSMQNCSSCVKVPVCGWCYATNTCMESNAFFNSSVDGTCKASDGFFNKCIECGNEKNSDNCEGCVAIGGCGWCAKINLCVPGGNQNPYNKMSPCFSGEKWASGKPFCPRKLYRNVALIAGLASLGVLILIALAAVAVFFFVRARRNQNKGYLPINT